MSELSLRSNSCLELSEIRKLDNLLKQCESISHEDISYETEQFQLYDYLENKRKCSSTGLLSKLTNGKLHRFCIDKTSVDKRILLSNINMSAAIVTIPPPGRILSNESSLNLNSHTQNNKIVPTLSRNNVIEDEYTDFKRAISTSTVRAISSQPATTTKRRKIHNCDSLEGAVQSQSDEYQQSDWKSHHHDEEEEKRIKISDVPTQVIKLGSTSRSEYKNFDTRSDRSDKSLSNMNSLKSRSKFSPTFLSRKASHKSENLFDTTARETLLPAKLDLKLREPVETVRINCIIAMLHFFAIHTIFLSNLIHYSISLKIRTTLHHSRFLHETSKKIIKSVYSD